MATLPAAPESAAPPIIDYTVIAPPGRPWTEADLLAFDANEHQYELVQGELRQMSPASFKHGMLEARLVIAIGMYLREHPTFGTVVTGDTGFKLREIPLTIRVPDVAFVAAERIPADNTEAFLPLAPDLVVEIVSPSESGKSIAEKLSDYLGAGTPLLWLIYPQQHEVQEYRLTQPFHIYRREDTLDGRDVLPGFRFPLHELFA